MLCEAEVGKFRNDDKFVLDDLESTRQESGLSVELIHLTSVKS
jgi:hypothetical protein